MQIARTDVWPDIPKLPPSDIKAFFQTQGYRVINLSQPWRHVVGVLEKDQHKYFFKLAAGQILNPKTQHEIFWNRYVADQLSPQQTWQVPKIFHTGFYHQTLFYYLAAYFGARPLATLYPPNPQSLKNYLPAIAQVIYDLTALDISAWPSGKTPVHIETPSRNLAKYFDDHNPQERQLAEIVTAAEPKLIYTLSHGDFTPWHLYPLSPGVLGLVDAEHGKLRPKYHDLAYFYLRVRFNLGEPALAKRSLWEFINLLPPQDQPQFWLDFKPVLAVKLINLYWEVSQARDPHDFRDRSACDYLTLEIVHDKVI
jgi:hypothetical protein